jgi:hypothetical protein
MAEFEPDGDAQNQGNPLIGQFRLMQNITTPAVTTVIPAFGGTIDGNGRNVNLDITKPSSDQVGFIGLICEDGIVIGLHVSGNVTGGTFVGGLVGLNQGDIDGSSSSVEVIGVNEVGSFAGNNGGKISNSAAFGDVSANARVGGFVGQNGSVIVDSFATGDISLTPSGVFTPNAFGGLVGSNLGSITKSYATGTVGDTDINDWVGGLVGGKMDYLNSDASVSDSVALNQIITGSGSGTHHRVVGYSDGNITNVFGLAGTIVNGAAVTAADPSSSSRDGATVLLVSVTTQAWWAGSDGPGFDFSPNGAWEWDTTANLPRLKGVPGIIDVDLPPDQPTLSDLGMVEIDGWQMIAELAHLQAMANATPGGNPMSDINQLSGNFRLARNITEPLTTPIPHFRGTLDGNGNSLAVNISSPTEGVGLIGTLYNGGSVTDLRVTGSVAGSGEVGGVVGVVRGSEVRNTSFTGNVTSVAGIPADKVGGIAGSVLAVGANQGIIANSSSSGTVSGGSNIGGIVGEIIAGGSVVDSVSTANVNSVTGDNVGGIAGSSQGTGGVHRSIASGTIAGNDAVGGLGGRSDAPLRDSVALNTSLTGTTSTRRISGMADFTALENNYAFSGVLVNTAPVNESDADIDGRHGETVGLTEVNDQEWWAHPDRGYDIEGAWYWDDVAQLPQLFGRQHDGARLAALPGTISGQSFFAPAMLEMEVIGFGGMEIVDGWMMVAEASHLQAMAEHEPDGEPQSENNPLMGSFWLANDIDEDVTTVIPFFGGTLEGEGHIISLDIRADGRAGLVATLTETGVVRNISVSGAVISEGEQVGAVAGFSHGRVEGVVSRANVSGLNRIGGLVGENHGSISGSSFSGLVAGVGQLLGGIAGENAGEITGSTFTGTVVRGVITNQPDTPAQNPSQSGTPTAELDDANQIVLAPEQRNPARRLTMRRLRGNWRLERFRKLASKPYLLY